MVDLTASILAPSERERILRAMVELCAERGYAQATVEAVIERADVSEQTFAALFDSREACVVAAFDAVIAEVLALVSASYSADASEWDSALVGIKAILEFMAAHPSFAHLSFIGGRQMGPPELHTAYDAGVRMLSAMLDRARVYSETASLPRAAGRAALGGAEAVVRREIVAGRTDRLPALLPDFIYGVTVTFLGQEEGLRLARKARALLST